VDRKKDMIVSGGENIYSTEVENVLYMHPAILEAAVFGVPDENWGEAVNAAVVLKIGETASEDEIIAFCKEQQASYKAPKTIVFLDELPKTGSGKIYKKGLRNYSLRDAAASAKRQRISYIIVAPTRAVLPVGSNGGATSTTSPPTKLRPRKPRSSAWASRVVRPPTSGVPVPGA
jgi:hypothetical protein